MSRTLMLGVLAVLAGCASGGSVVAGEEFTLPAGNQVVLPDAATLRFVGIANDSRCPPKVQCIRAGDADVLFDFAPSGRTATRVILNTERMQAAAIGSWQLQLIELAPGGITPRVTVRIDPNGNRSTP